MKRILITCMVALCGVFTACNPSENILPEATARLIALKDLESSSGGLLPSSRTAVLLSGDGVLVTCYQQGETLPSFQDQFLALFPVMDENHTVTSVKAFIGQAISADAKQCGTQVDQDTLVSIKLVETKMMPSPVSCDDSKNNIFDPGVVVDCYSYPNSHFAQDAQVPEQWKQMMFSSLQQVCKHTRAGSGCFELPIGGTQLHLQHYMTPKNSRAAVNADRATNKVAINLLFGDGEVGSPLFLNKRLRGVVSRKIEDPTMQGIALSSSQVLNFASNERIVIDTGHGYVAIVLSIVGGLVGIVVIVLVVRRLLPPRAEPTLFTLVGSDGTIYKVTNSMLRSKVLIGRSRSAALRFSHPAISGKHASLMVYNGRAAIVDNGSSHGTVVDGQRLAPGQPHVLHSGSVIMLADYRIVVQ